jgi:hypothetical protein
VKCTNCNTPIKPVVAVDIDGTMGQYHGHLLAFMEDYFDARLPDHWGGSGNWEDYLGIDKASYQEAKLAFRQGGFKRWMPVFREAHLPCSTARACGAEVWITTTRPYLRLDSVDPDTREWLRRNGIQYDHLMYDDDKYGKLRERVGVGRVVAVVEDLPEQYERAVAILGPQIPILVERWHNQDFREANKGRLTTARSMADVSRYVSGRISGWYRAHA